MERVLFVLVVQWTAFTAGSALFAAYLTARVWYETRLDGKRHLYHFMARTGFATTNLVLLFAVVAAGTVQPSAVAWVFILGLAVAGAGYVGIAKHAADDLAKAEQAKAEQAKAEQAKAEQAKGVSEQDGAEDTEKQGE